MTLQHDELLAHDQQFQILLCLGQAPHPYPGQQGGEEMPDNKLNHRFSMFSCLSGLLLYQHRAKGFASTVVWMNNAGTVFNKK
jgi:hypothetical protein